MQLPLGHAIPGSSLVCKLQKSLYGLKQASRQWNAKLTSVLLDFGFAQSKADYSLFTKTTSTGFTSILVYVDDLIIAGDDLHEIESIKKLFDDRFRIKDLGKLKFFLGVEMAHSKQGISHYQRKYTLDLLEDCGMLGCKPSSTPMDYTIKLSKSSKGTVVDISKYQRLVGQLLYLTNARPDISYAIGKLSQFLDCLNSTHH